MITVPFLPKDSKDGIREQGRRVREMARGRAGVLLCVACVTGRLRERPRARFAAVVRRVHLQARGEERRGEGKGYEKKGDVVKRTNLLVFVILRRVAETMERFFFHSRFLGAMWCGAV